jgi:hypothetical protein
VHTDVLVFDHYAPGVWQRARGVEVLIRVLRRSGKTLPEVFLLSVSSDSQTVNRAYINAGVALDAERIGEVGLHVAVETALDLGQCLLEIKAHFDLDVESFESLA